MPLRHHLLVLVIGVLMPVVLFSATVVWRLAVENRAVAERRLIGSANELAQAVDREVASAVRALTVLSQSDRLRTGDFPGFYDEAQRIIRDQELWQGIILLDLSGQMLVSTLRPVGVPLQKVVDRSSFDRMVETRQPLIGNLKRGIGGKLAFPVRVPVLQGDDLRYVLTLVINPEAVSRLLGMNKEVPNEWTRSLIDGEHTIVARTRSPETFIGRKASADFRELVSHALEGVAKTTSLDGMKAYTGFSRAPLSDFTAIVVVPREVLDGPVRRSLLGLGATGLGALVVSGIGATVLSRRVKAGMRQAADAAASLLRGQHPQPHNSSITEVAQLHEALVRAADLLVVRERERNENLERALAAQAEADAANGAKDKFLAVLSHELRTPLTPVMLAVHLLESDPRHTDAMRQMLAMIRRNVQLEVKLIDDLLDLTRIARGKLVLNVSAVDVHEKIHEVASICQAEIQEKQLRLTLDLLAQRCTVNADPARLQQVLWNLFKNAVKFTADRGHITVRTQCLADRLRVDVIDDGIGIEPAELARIFNAFEQGNESVTRQFGGLGLGLAISKAIVDLHGGTLSAHSGGTDKGATFSLSFPLAATDEPPRANGTPPAEPEQAPGRRSARILLVEDNPDSSRMMAMAMQRYGYHIHAAEGVDAALKLASDHRFDLVISDLGLPDGTGYDLMRQLREKYNLKGVALSGYGMDGDIRKSYEAGFAEHLTKPVEMERLDSAVRALLDQP